jgi:hypothetical protein
MLERLSKLLLEKEILFPHDLEEILGPRPFDKAAEVAPTVNSVAQEEVIQLTETPSTEEDLNPTV